MSEAEWASLADVPSIADERALNAMENGSGAILQPFAGLSHADVLALEFPPERMLVQDLVPIGAVGTIAGVPETYKSWQAQHIAVMVASGEGELFGKGVEHAGPVGYFWQDDSTREEAERIKLYDRIRRDGSDLPLRWFLNEGLRLPGDIVRLKITIREFGFCLVVLDSFYNVLLGMDLKDEEAEQVVALLKSEIADELECTVLIVDHMPWATEQNRKRLRAYGGVFKGAAIRFGLYLDAVGNNLYVEARGNNIRGFKRQMAQWDESTLELHLVDTNEAVSEDEYEQRIIEYLTEHTDQTSDQMDAIKGGREALLAARKRLLDAGTVQTHKGGLTGRKTLWNLSNHADSNGPTEQMDVFGPVNQSTGPTSPPLRGGTVGGLIGTEWTNADDEDSDDGIPF